MPKERPIEETYAKLPKITEGTAAKIEEKTSKSLAEYAIYHIGKKVEVLAVYGPIVGGSLLEFLGLYFSLPELINISMPGLSYLYNSSHSGRGLIGGGLLFVAGAVSSQVGGNTAGKLQALDLENRIKDAVKKVINEENETNGGGGEPPAPPTKISVA